MQKKKKENICKIFAQGLACISVQLKGDVKLKHHASQFTLPPALEPGEG